MRSNKFTIVQDALIAMAYHSDKINVKDSTTSVPMRYTMPLELMWLCLVDQDWNKTQPQSIAMAFAELNKYMILEAGQWSSIK